MSAAARTPVDRRGRVYRPAVGPRLRPLLWVLLVGFALLSATGVYMAGVTALTWKLGSTQQTPFYFLMVLLHLALGLAIVTPFVLFGVIHLATSWKRPNRAAVRYGLALLAVSTLILVSGVVLIRLDVFSVKDPRVRDVGYWLHVVTPLVAVVLYVRHRLAGPMIRWQWARRVGAVTAFVLVGMGLLHAQDPTRFAQRGPKEGRKYFEPSSAITADGNFIAADSLMTDQYCLRCHQDAYEGWFHSSHHLSSFNNPLYKFSVRETRQVSLKEDGNTKRSRWCAGCHDPVPFFGGDFDNAEYDDTNSKSSQAGITCVTCHSITSVDSTRGNAAFTISQPRYYPGALSDIPLVRAVSDALVKAKPEYHKSTLMRPLMRDSRFCSTCHKVGLPYDVTHYKDFSRGQNHWDTFLLSGVSGHGARSFYYPPKAKSECAQCHMELVASNDFGARDFDESGTPKIHSHMFTAANTGLGTVLKDEKMTAAAEKYLTTEKVRVDVFALREGAGVDGALLGPIRPATPVLKRGAKYLVEVVVRTLGVGHPLTQGTVDSNEIWVELIATQDGKVIGRSGGRDADDRVDPFSHFINVYMLDRNGKRIDRRNPQDIFVPLYNKQIPPGAGQVVHFGLETPGGATSPITLEARVNYRKFDRTYMDYVFGKGQGPKLPVVVTARDEVVLPVEGGKSVTNPPSPIKDGWQRWNDYGIGLLLEGGDKGGQKGELRQAEAAFGEVAKLGRVDGWVNLARVLVREGRVPEAREAVDAAAKQAEPPAPWTINWLTAQINERNGHLDEAIAAYESVLATKIPARGFDFSLDYEVINALANVYYARSRVEPATSPERTALLRKSIENYERVLTIDSENVAAHYGLGQAYGNAAWRADLSGAAKVGIYPRRPEGGVVEELHARILWASETGVDANVRAARALGVAESIERLLGAGRNVVGSPLEPLHEVVAKLAPVWSTEADPAARAALSKTLESVHKALHGLLKVDETAEGRAFRLARERDPAADQNAQAIVIHSLHRPGAPGIAAVPQSTLTGPSRESASIDPKH